MHHHVKRFLFSLVKKLSMKNQRDLSPDVFLKQKALAFLSRREHSEQELKQKLTRYLENETDYFILESVLSYLKTNGYLSNTRFCESYLRSKAPRYGTRYLKQSLRLKGVEETEISQQLASYVTTEYDRAREIWEKRFHAQDPEDVKQYTKQVRFLQGRGFSPEIIRQIVKLKRSSTQS